MTEHPIWQSILINANRSRLVIPGICKMLIPGIGNIKYHNRGLVYAKCLFALRGGLYFCEPIAAKYRDPGYLESTEHTQLVDERQSLAINRTQKETDLESNMATSSSDCRQQPNGRIFFMFHFFFKCFRLAWGCCRIATNVLLLFIGFFLVFFLE